MIRGGDGQEKIFGRADYWYIPVIFITAKAEVEDVESEVDKGSCFTVELQSISADSC
jgi:hypothetical protein|tara:strand:- start:8148 stop:8318 length:171 start_codon:yes stop_codon:yes gene_type:complete